MECTNCGNTMKDGTVICDVCGASNETVEFNTINDSSKEQSNGNRVAIVKRRKINPPPMSLMQYVYMLLVMCVPIFGIVMTFLWAFNKKDNPNRTNLARAMLIVGAIVLVILIVLSILAGTFIGEFIKNYFSMF
jgi:hypothetical protein